MCDADIVLVFDGGIIMASGTPAELSVHNDWFAQLAKQERTRMEGKKAASEKDSVEED